MAKILLLKEKPELRITADAYIKMQALIAQCDKEIGWFGTVQQDGNVFTINDILVPPQTVTAATVTSDEKEEMEWRASLSDEQYNTLRFHGHSHVNMSVSPSATDTKYRAEVISNIGKEGYYIFFIGNKKGEMSLEFYDLKKNIVYDHNDCPMTVVLSDGTLAPDFAKKSMEMVKTYTYQSSYSKVYTKKDTTPKKETKKDEDDFAGGKKGSYLSSYYDGCYDSEWDSGYDDTESWWDRRYGAVR